ncbi:MAG: serine--tRNA ligase [Bacteroidales bacterium]|jgi:seryl-tRNA synthetase|nr:serine--tRNA ligase [Bacteroidales bacterium]
MIPLQTLREKPQYVIERLKVKNFEAEEIVNNILSLDEERRKTQKSLDEKLAESNQLAREIGVLFKQGRTAEANEMKVRTSLLKEETRELTEKLTFTEKALDELIVRLPNIPAEQVKSGKSAADNEVVLQEGNIPSLGSDALPHWELAQKYNLISFELGAKVTGAGFPFYIGKGAKLQRALISFFLDEAVAAGFLEFETPLMVNEDSAFATGQLPDKEGQMYHVPVDNLYLIPTAEVPVTNLYRNTVVKHSELPVKLCAYSACFRREAGSYGKDVRGLNRLHQFDKVEIVEIAHPDESFKVLDEMTSHVAGLLRKLELPFRMVRLCGGDMSFTSAITYDFEVYSAAQQKWLEVSSVSNFTDFQANRLKLRFKDESGKIRLAHTLNGSALALPRIVAALLENNQTEDGINVPQALVPYTGFNKIS